MANNIANDDLIMARDTFVFRNTYFRCHLAQDQIGNSYYSHISIFEHDTASSMKSNIAVYKKLRIDFFKDWN